jgi:hypothetical protein
MASADSQYFVSATTKTGENNSGSKTLGFCGVAMPSEHGFWARGDMQVVPSIRIFYKRFGTDTNAGLFWTIGQVWTHQVHPGSALAAMSNYLYNWQHMFQKSLPKIIREDAPAVPDQTERSLWSCVTTICSRGALLVDRMLLNPNGHQARAFGSTSMLKEAESRGLGCINIMPWQLLSRAHHTD